MIQRVISAFTASYKLPMHRLPYCLTGRDKNWFTPTGMWLHPPILTSQWCWQKHCAQLLRERNSLGITFPLGLDSHSPSFKKRSACMPPWITGQHWTNTHMHRQNLYFVSGSPHWRSTRHVHIMQLDSKVLPHCSQESNPLGHIT